MRHYYPIIIIEDDDEDKELLQQIFTELDVKNPLVFFSSCLPALEYLSTTPEIVFLILCDVNIMGMNGLEMRKLIDEDPQLRKKAIPFVFYSATARKEQVEQAYKMMIQGYFEKPHGYDEIKATIKLIFDYWKVCIHPNNWY